MYGANRKLIEDMMRISIRKLCASLAVVLLIVGTLFFAGCTEEGEEESSPENTFDEFVEKINVQDGEGMLDLTDSSLIENESYDEGKQDIIDSVNNGDLTINDYEIKEVRNEGDIGSKNRSWFENVTERFDDEGVNVDEYCLLTVNWTTSHQDQGEQTSEITYPMFKVESEWYVGLIAFFMAPRQYR